MTNDDYIKIDWPIHYAEKNVAQCWACKNCIGQKKFNAGILMESYITTAENGVILPECRVADRYMLFVNELPCPYFEVVGRAKNVE